MDDDQAGQEGAELFARKMGAGRVKIVSGTYLSGQRVKDANDALRQGVDMEILISRAKTLPHKQIISFDEIKEAVYREFAEPNKLCGVPCRVLPGLNRILKGHRKGELTIFTGATGVGKTTVLSQLSLDLAMQGCSTLWGSFEIKNTRLAKTQMTQYCGMEHLLRANDSVSPISNPTHIDLSQPENFDLVGVFFLCFRVLCNC